MYCSFPNTIELSEQVINRASLSFPANLISLGKKEKLLFPQAFDSTLKVMSRRIESAFLIPIEFPVAA